MYMYSSVFHSISVVCVYGELVTLAYMVRMYQTTIYCTVYDDRPNVQKQSERTKTTKEKYRKEFKNEIQRSQYIYECSVFYAQNTIKILFG